MMKSNAMLANNMKQLKSGINRPIVCRKCGHKVGYLKVNPKIYDLFKKSKRKETFGWIFLIAFITQLLSDIILDSVKWLF